MDQGSDLNLSNHQREYPAWGYLLIGAVFTGTGLWLVVAGATDGSRQALLPWFLVLMGVTAIGAGIREWILNGSPTARRTRSTEERERDAEQAMQHRRTLRLVVALVVIAGVVAYSLLVD